MTWQSFLDQNHDRYQAELLDFLRIPSISALPEHAGDVRQAAIYLGTSVLSWMIAVWLGDIAARRLNNRTGL